MCSINAQQFNWPNTGIQPAAVSNVLAQGLSVTLNIYTGLKTHNVTASTSILPTTNKLTTPPRLAELCDRSFYLYVIRSVSRITHKLVNR